MKGAEAELHGLARAGVTGKPKTDPLPGRLPGLHFVLLSSLF